MENNEKTSLLQKLLLYTSLWLTRKQKLSRILSYMKLENIHMLVLTSAKDSGSVVSGWEGQSSS